MSKPILGNAPCVVCDGLVNIRQRKAGRGGVKMLYFSHCPNCGDMDQSGDEATQTRLKDFLVVDNTRLEPQETLSSPAEPLTAAVVESLADVEEKPVFEEKTPVLNPRINTPLDTPAKTRKYWLVGGLLSLAGVLIAIGRG